MRATPDEEKGKPASDYWQSTSPQAGAPLFNCQHSTEARGQWAGGEDRDEGKLRLYMGGGWQASCLCQPCGLAMKWTTGELASLAPPM